MHLTWKLSVVNALNSERQLRYWNVDSLNSGLVPLISNAGPSSLSRSLGVGASRETKPQFEPVSAIETSSPKVSDSLDTLTRPSARLRLAR